MILCEVVFDPDRDLLVFRTIAAAGEGIVELASVQLDDLGSVELGRLRHIRQPDEWAQPTGSHDAYPIDAYVTFGGAVYRSKINDNVWSPIDYPAGWELL